MTLDEIIQLFKDIEAGKEPKIGYHLHDSIRKLNERYYHLNDSYSNRFSAVLEALKDEQSIS